MGSTGQGPKWARLAADIRHEGSRCDELLETHVTRNAGTGIGCLLGATRHLGKPWQVVEIRLLASVVGSALTTRLLKRQGI